jgi:hypothetical protein
MNNEEMGPMDSRGRALAHYFFSELEKISAAVPAGAFGARRAPHALREMAQFETGQTRRAVEAMPWYKRWFGSTSWDATRQARGRAKGYSTEMNKNVSDAEAIMRDPTKSRADREAAVNYLEAGKAERPNVKMTGGFKETRPGGASPGYSRMEELKAGGGREGEFAEKPADSPMVRGAKMIGGGTLLGAGGLYGGQKYLQHKKNQPPASSYGAY